MYAITTPLEYKGDLAVTTLPEIFFSIYRFQVPGIIEARDGGEVKKVFIKNGNILHATSSNLDDSLGPYLHRQGLLTTEQLESAMAARRGTQERLGSLLIQHGLLTPAQVLEAIRAQVESIVWSLFYWKAGKVTFSIGDFADSSMIQIMLPMRQVILRGIKRAPDPKELVSRLGTKTTVFEPIYQAEDLIEIAIDGRELDLLRLVDGQRSLYDICTTGPFSAADNAKLIYAYCVLRLVQAVPETAPEAGD